MSEANLHVQETDSYDDLKAQVSAGSGLFVLDFFAPWCGPCQRLVSLLPGMAKENPNVTFIKVNIEENKALAAQFGVSSIPHIHFVKGKDGDIDRLDEVVGFNVASLKANIAKYA